MDDTNNPSASPNAASEPGSATLKRALQSHLPLAVAAGTVLRDRYRLTGTLYVGQVATLYRAEEIESGRAVTVKVFHEIGRNDRSRLEVLHRPTPRGAARLDLPSAFIAVYECEFTDDGRLFLVTELVEGPSVADLLRRTPPLAPIRALELAMRVGEALEVVLNLGLLDLPVAPRDIVVVNDGDRVKLRGSDMLILRRLGLAEQLAATEASGRDPRYASPEELAGLPATERSVVYRFGVLLYELLCGSPPFEGTTPAQVRSQLRPLPVRFRDRHRALPASVDRLVSRMLDPDPVARPGDLTWILNELWDADCHLRAQTPTAPTDAASSPASAAPAMTARRFWTRRLAFAALPVLAMGGTLLAWPYLFWGPTARTSVPAPVRPAVDVAPPPAPLVSTPSLAVPPSGPATSSGRVSTQVPSFHPRTELPAPAAAQSPPAPTVDGAGSRVRSSAPAVPRVAQPETPPAPADAKAVSPAVAPAPEPPPSAPRPAEAPAPRRAAVPTEPEPTSARARSTPPPQPETVVAVPPARRSEPRPEDPRAADPGAIIEWLVRESPRIGE
jgi:eukaryotic-like serine/threonine-protein kinase